MKNIKTFTEHIKENKKVNHYKEIEFVCHNSDYPNSSNRVNQIKLYKDLKKLQKDSDYKILPYMQDFCDEQHQEFSLAVIILDNTHNLMEKVKDLASKYDIEIDMYNKVDNQKVDKIIKGDMYNNVV